jgi:hypothetical protein
LKIDFQSFFRKFKKVLENAIKRKNFVIYYT